jgi:hypothetical protein
MNENLVVEKLEALSTETRRQGRASIAAQASAEACLEAVTEVREGLRVVSEKLSSVQKHVTEPPKGKEEGGKDGGLVMGMLPVADAIDRVVLQAERLQQASKRPGAMARLFGAVDVTAQAQSLAEASRLLKAAMRQTFETIGIQVDERCGVGVDGQVHRVVEARGAEEGQDADMVIEVVRPGYSRFGEVLREADVVATRPGK